MRKCLQQTPVTASHNIQLRDLQCHPKCSCTVLTPLKSMDFTGYTKARRMPNAYIFLPLCLNAVPATLLSLPWNYIKIDFDSYFKIFLTDILAYFHMFLSTSIYKTCICSMLSYAQNRKKKWQMEIPFKLHLGDHLVHLHFTGCLIWS